MQRLEKVNRVEWKTQDTENFSEQEHKMKSAEG